MIDRNRFHVYLIVQAKEKSQGIIERNAESRYRIDARGRLINKDQLAITEILALQFPHFFPSPRLAFDQVAEKLEPVNS